MGTTAIALPQGVENPLFRQLMEALTPPSGSGRVATATENTAVDSSTPTDVFQLAQSSPGDQTSLVESSFYSSRAESFSLVAKMQEVAAAGNTETQDTAQQTDFAFVAELHSEQLSRFQQRTEAVAQGLKGSQQKSYLELSQQVATRFDMKLNVSGAALNGFATASDGLKGMPKIFDSLIDLSHKLMDRAQAFFDQFMTQFDGTWDTSKAQDFATKFQKMVNDFLQQIGNLGNAPGQTAKTGTTQNTSVEVQMEFSFSFEGKVAIVGQQVQQSDPVMLDLDGDGLELSHYSDGAIFDITGSGQAVKTAFVKGGDAFLALDRNRDGIINSGKELFGDQNGAANGYEELRKLDSNADGRIDQKDQGFADLLLFRDNGNGKTDKGELISLSAAGIESISLQYLQVDQHASGGNRIAQAASYRTINGRTGNAGDAVLNYLA